MADKQDKKPNPVEDRQQDKAIKQQDEAIKIFEEKLNSGTCRIRDQGKQLKGIGVLVYDPSFIQEKLKVFNADYLILSSSEIWGGSSVKECKYAVEFSHYNEPNKSKDLVNVVDIMSQSVTKGGLEFTVLNTQRVKDLLVKNTMDKRAFKIDKIYNLEALKQVQCYYVKSGSTEMKHHGDLVIGGGNIPKGPNNLPLGSLLLNSEKEVLGTLGKDATGKYVVNTVAAVVNKAQGISCIANRLALASILGPF